jgi:alpha-tubulin suppressor-like RCC1 family protein
VWCWGTGPFLRDDAGAVTTELTPVKLTLPPVTSVGIGYSAGCAATAEGVLCWGSNGDGQLGPATRDPSDVGGPRPMPVPTDSPTRVVTVGRATFARRADNTLVSWGSNPTIGRVSPIFPNPHPQNIALGGVFMMDLADDNGCATAGGTGYCWGTPVVPPRPGNGSVTERALPEPVVAPEPIVQIATTRSYDLPNEGPQRYRWCASGVSGAVYCAGKNASGQAGDGTKNFAFDAVKVAGLPERAAQVKTTPDTTCALLTNGKVHCWGSNNNGQLGNGQNRGRSLVPVEVVLP